MKDFLSIVFLIFIILFIIHYCKYFVTINDKNKFRAKPCPVKDTEGSSSLRDSNNHDRYSVSSEHLGKIGESAVSSVLAGYCSHSKAYFFDNVTLSFDNGTTQIDHILLTKKGILVIETKNWSGWIFGKTEDSVWTQVVGKNKMVFQNPRRQNYKHCLAVYSVIQFVPKGFIKNLVILTGNAVFKTEHPNGVIYLNKFEHVLNNINFGEISDENFYRAIGVIEYLRLERSEQTDLDHRDYLNRTFGSPTFHNSYSYRKKNKYYSKDYQ